MFVKYENWLHAFTSDSHCGEVINPSETANGNSVPMEKIMRIICKNNDSELQAHWPDKFQSLYSSILRASFLSTLSCHEFGSFAALLSPEEHILLHAISLARDTFHLSSEASLAIENAISLFLGEPQNDCDAEMAASFVPLIPFLKRTEVLLAGGGDDRLTIDFKGQKLNKYLSSTIPRPNLIHRGSCTCSSTSMEHFIFADQIRRKFLRAVCDKAASPGATAKSTHDAICSEIEHMQDSLLHRLRRVLNMADMGAELVLFPSGSDAEFLPLIVALIRSLQLTLAGGNSSSNVRVINYVSAAGEVGSGTAAAAGGKHFSPLLPRGDHLAANFDCVLGGLDSSVISVVQFKPRTKDGEVVGNDDFIAERVRADLSANPFATAVVHVVCGSKTGLVQPSLSTVATLVEEFGERLLIVVDACQLRCELSQIRRYTDLGYMTLITGSKFFTAPPFAGAVVLPQACAAQLESHIAQCVEDPSLLCTVPTGLRQYLSPYDVPKSMPEMRRFLSHGGEWVNFGLHLRWACALNTMEQYASLPKEAVEQFTARWVENVQRVVAEQAPYLRVLPQPTTAVEGLNMYSDMVSGVSGIVSILVSTIDFAALEEKNALASAYSGFSHLIRTNLNSSMADATSASAVTMHTLTFDECKEFHKCLTQESGGVKDSHGIAVLPVKDIRVMLGQPVKLGDNNFAVIRIALGADMVVSALKCDDTEKMIESILREDAAVVCKMSLLARSWHTTQHSEEHHDVCDGTAVGSAMMKLKAIDHHLTRSTTISANRNRSDSQFPITAHCVAAVLRQLYPSTSPVPPSCVLYDLDSVDSAVDALYSAFNQAFPAGAKFNHCFAIKAAPLTYLLHNFVKQGLGLETASIVELKQALRSGCPASKIVFDSPCKTVEELEFALRVGAMVNANSYAEVEKIAMILAALMKQGFHSSSVVGLRVNPMSGAGSIDALSTATATSKFGVPCMYVDQHDGTATPAGRVDLREEIIATYVKYPFLNAIMCHVGSQGMPLAHLVAGANCILTLADEIDARCSAGRITHVDIGGGLSSNYSSDTIDPTFTQYAELLFEQYSAQLRNARHRTYVTEFGKALVAKSAAIVAKVEEVQPFASLAHCKLNEPEQQAEQVLAKIHVGADLLLRTAYNPQAFSHRISFLDAHKQVLRTAKPEETASSPLPPSPATDLWSINPSALRRNASVTIAGPLCFSGDVLGKNITLPEPVPGDLCLVLDAGANTLSLFSRHCSRASPAVFAFRRVNLQAPVIGQLSVHDGYVADVDIVDNVDGVGVGSVVVGCIREAESEEEVMKFWG